MATTDQKTVKTTFLNIVNGHLSQNVPEGTEGAIERVNSKEKKVFEKRFGSVLGFLYELYIYEHESFGNMLVIKTRDKIGMEVIECSLRSSYAQDFLNRLPGVDITKPVELSTYRIQREDNPEKYNELFTIKQGDSKILRQFTKENPQGLPKAEQKKEGKKLVWDFTEVTNFYFGIAEKYKAILTERKNEILQLATA